MKKLLILFTSILLTACSGLSENTNNVLNITESQYEEYDFIINIDSDWEIIEEDKFTSSIPSNTAVVFRNNMQNEIFTANIIISRTAIEDFSTAKDFALNSLEEAKNKISSFTEIYSEDYKILLGEGAIEAYKISFQGKENPSSVKVRFEQIFTIYNGVGYTITGAYIPKEEENVVNNIQGMLESFSLK